MTKKVEADQKCYYCGEKFKVKPNMRKRAKYCSRKKCQERKIADKRKRFQASLAKQEIGVKEIILTPISDSREYISRDNIYKCANCEMLSNCKRRINIGMWVACEIPSYGGILYLYFNDLVEDAKELAVDKSLFDVLTDILLDS